MQLWIKIKKIVKHKLQLTFERSSNNASGYDDSWSGPARQYGRRFVYGVELRESLTEMERTAPIALTVNRLAFIIVPGRLDQFPLTAFIESDDRHQIIWRDACLC